MCNISFWLRNTHSRIHPPISNYGLFSYQHEHKKSYDTFVNLFVSFRRTSTWLKFISLRLNYNLYTSNANYNQRNKLKCDVYLVRFATRLMQTHINIHTHVRHVFCLSNIHHVRAHTHTHPCCGVICTSTRSHFSTKIQKRREKKQKQIHSCCIHLHSFPRDFNLNPNHDMPNPTRTLNLILP